MALRKAVSALSCCTILIGCNYNVTLAVRNSAPSPAPPPLNITAITKDKDGSQTGSIGLGTVNPGQTSLKQTFSVKHGSSYVVHGDLASGVNVFASGLKTVDENLPNELVDITTLQPASIDPNDVSAIQSAFGRLGANVGFNPITVPSALGSLFGGLVWYVDTNDPLTPESQLVMVISPSQLTGAVALADFQYPQGPSASHDDDISTDASVKVSGSVPLWGNLAGGFAANSLYKTHWSMVGFGNVTKTDTASFQDKLNGLSALQKSDICSRLQTPNSHMMYVNELYVIKSAVMTYQKGKTIDASASISGASVIAGNAAYDFSSSQTEQNEIDDTVVNVEGPTFTKDTMSFCPVTVAPGPVAAPTPTATVQSVVRLGNTAATIQNILGQSLSLQRPQLQHSVKAPQ